MESLFEMSMKPAPAGGSAAPSPPKANHKTIINSFPFGQWPGYKAIFTPESHRNNIFPKTIGFYFFSDLSGQS